MDNLIKDLLINLSKEQKEQLDKLKPEDKNYDDLLDGFIGIVNKTFPDTEQTQEMELDIEEDYGELE